MKFNYKGRGFVVLTLSAMLVVVGTVNYQLSRKSLLETSKEFAAYEQAQNEKNTDEKDKEEAKVVDSKESKVEEMTKNRDLIIPGKVAVLKGDIEENLPGWNVIIGTEESMEIPKFLKDYKAKQDQALANA